MNQIEKKYDQYGMKIFLHGSWNKNVDMCSEIEEVLKEAKEAGVTPNFLYDARNLNYEFGNDIFCLLVLPKNIFGKYVPVTIYATDEHIQDEKMKEDYGWHGIAYYFEGFEEEWSKKILFFDYNEALESYKAAFNHLSI